MDTVIHGATVFNVNNHNGLVTDSTFMLLNERKFDQSKLTNYEIGQSVVYSQYNYVFIIMKGCAYFNGLFGKIK